MRLQFDTPAVYFAILVAEPPLSFLYLDIIDIQLCKEMYYFIDTVTMLMTFVCWRDYLDDCIQMNT